MQIGDADLDAVCDSAVVPALQSAGLDPRRVDRHNTGDLLKSEIVGFLERSEIIVADLTNERPNCYLEVGYAMGLGKKPNLILTAREDHLLDSPSHPPGGPKIHFDLSGYDILFWDPQRLGEFRDELEKRVRRRRALVAPGPSTGGLITPFDTDWVAAHQETARTGLSQIKRQGFMELSFALTPPKGLWGQRELLDAVREANISTFGWPIGIVLDRQDRPWRPRPTPDGVVAEVLKDPEGSDRTSYDYWALRRNGDFFLLQDLFEDQRRPGTVFLDTRVVRTTEALLFCGRLYNRLGVAPTSTVAFRLRHGGLSGRSLTVANRGRNVFEGRTTEEDSVDAEVSFKLDGLDGRLVELVTELLRPLFMLFDFFELSPEIYADLVNGFVEGEVR